ncbi:GntR family transcriptional regulator (plasmid) [Halorussus limi]|uniref:GntR family transcriptional regulator n=1 Tax=Halorussus limi TaxID=2938695 RepID=A0A8U0HZH6_9EURY|nr:GntR family transcriptional regulator [Halorussus limi]UPV76327.1 GntR family transcriptional regulator [Halorussus limi]
MRSGPADLQKCLRTRSHFLARLRHPRRKRELADELEESRSTIDRALRELEGVGFVERADRGYRTTLTGELAFEAYRRYVACLDGLVAAHDALKPLPTGAALDGALFEDATVALPTQCSPHAPVESFEAVLDDADHARVFATAVIPAYVDIFHEQIVDRGMTADVVCAEGVLDWILSRREEQLAAIAGSDGVTLSETSADRAFSLVVTERESDASEHEGSAGVPASATERTPDRSASARAPDGDQCREDDGRATETRDAHHPTKRVGAMLYDEGRLVGFVHTDARAAVAWGEAVFDRLAADAMQLGAPADD